MDPVKLYQRHTVEELVAMAAEIRADPANVNPEHTSGRSIYLLTPTARKKLDAMGWAIYHHQQDRRKG